MVDLAWRKLIIKVECSRNPENEKTNHTDSDNFGSTIYICRSCPDFRTQTKEAVDTHLSEVHHIPAKQVSEQSSTGVLDKANLSVAAPSSPSAVLVSTAPLSVGDTLCSGTSPVPQPHSPISPLTKDSYQPRKKITVTLNASPTLSLSTGTPMVTVQQTALNDTSRLEEAAEETEGRIEAGSPNTLAFLDPGSSADTSSSTVLSTSSSPEFRTKLSTQIPYECPSCGQRFVRLKSFEKHKIRQHGDTAVVSGKRSVTRTPNKPPADKTAETNHTSDLKVSCADCGRSFSSKQARELHARVHRAQTKYKCALCGYLFRSLGSLKRHAASMHSIVPESAFPDNPKDKDFEVPVELDSDTDSGSSTASAKPQRGRKRRLNPAQLGSNRRANLLPRSTKTADASTMTAAVDRSAFVATVAPPPVRRRRGRPRRSSTWVMRTLDNHSDVAPVDPLTISSRLEEARLSEIRGETRYRTILPRPPGGTVMDSITSQPLMVNRTHRRRTRRSRKVLQKPSVLVPLLTDNRRRNAAAVGPTIALGTPTQVAQAVYLDPFTVASGSYVTLDPTAYNTGTYAIDVTSTDESGHLVGKPPHVLTVAAAYASQLPPGSIPATSNEECDSLVKGDSTVECKSANPAVSNVTVQPAPVLSGIQIYPTPWVEGRPQTVTTGSDTSIRVSEAESTDRQPSADGTSANQSTVACAAATATAAPLPIPVAQPLQLYPVIGQDGVTTMYYYMAAPVEFVQTPSTNVVTGSQAAVSSTNDPNSCLSDSGQTGSTSIANSTAAYYCTYTNPVTWLTQSGESGEFTMAASSSSCPNTATYDQVSAPEDTFELDELFEQSSVTQPDPESDTSRVVDHNSTDCPDETSGEKIEVIELDASQFDSELNDSILDEDAKHVDQDEEHDAQSAEKNGEEQQGSHEVLPNPSAELSDHGTIPTEVVDLDAGEEFERCFGHTGSPQPIENLNHSYSSMPAVVKEHSPKKLLDVSPDLLAVDTTEDLPLVGESKTQSPQRYSSPKPIGSESCVAAVSVTGPTKPVLEVMHTNIPSFTHLFSHSLSARSRFDDVANRSSRDGLQTPPIEPTETFDYASVTIMKETQ